MQAAEARLLRAAAREFPHEWGDAGPEEEDKGDEPAKIPVADV